MKRHTPEELAAVEAAEDSLYEAILMLKNVEELRRFFRDLCTPAEVEAMVDRWRVVDLVRAGLPYREIHDRTGVSVTTVGRVARFYEQGYGGYRIAAERLAAPRGSARKKPR